MNESGESIPEKIELSEARPEDARELIDITREGWLDAFVNEKLGVTPELVGWRFSGERLEERVANLEKALADGSERAILAHAGKRIAGFVSYRIDNEFNFLESFFVRKEYRGLVGPKLIKAVTDVLNPTKDSKALVVAYNDRARRLYEHLGFSEESRFDRKLKGPNGEIPQPMILLVKKAEQLTKH